MTFEGGIASLSYLRMSMMTLGKDDLRIYLYSSMVAIWRITNNRKWCDKWKEHDGDVSLLSLSL